MKMFYLSHPYTGDEEKNRAEAYFIASRLARKYPDVVFFNPLDAMQHTVTAGLGYDTVLKQCIEILRRCDGIIMAGDWSESAGCREEFRVAKERGLKLYTIEEVEEWRGTPCWSRPRG